MPVTLESLLGGAANVEKIASGFANVDGPVFSRRGYLLFADVSARRIMKWQDGHFTAYRTDSNGARGLSFDHEGRVIACEADGLTRAEKDGSITVLAPNCKPADVVYAIDRSIYFSSVAGIYQLTPASTLHIVSQSSKQPRGVALAPNQQKLYVSDADSHEIHVHDLKADGSLAPGRTLAALSAAPAGLKTDEEGNLWIAVANGVTVFDSTGAHLGTIAIPEKPSNCNWGEGFRDLYVTAETTVYKISTKVVGTRTY